MLGVVMASAMRPLFLMTERHVGGPDEGGQTPVVPRARQTSDGGSGAGSSGPGPAAVVATPVRRRGWRERGWDIPWLGGRSTAPWVVLATVAVLVVALVGTVFAAQRPDRLGWTPKTIAATSDTSVVFTFSVFKAPKAVAACTILAADQNGGVGALRDIPIPARADGAQDTELTVTVPTTRRAETAVLDGCRIVTPG
ncbi:MAG: hypothetical protein QOC98_469 [Frankiaceae bacterium]|nr:hypothetical protein [Frankiaceae bacterium]